MAIQILALHWKTVRWALAPFVIAAFGLPLLAVRGPGPMGAGAYYGLVDAAQLWLPLFPALAALTGAVLALSAWHWDHQQNHVYALSLPVSRTEYALLKLGGGALLALIPVGAFLAGSLTAVAAVELPSGLNAYPFSLSLRFLLATLVAYAFLFAFAAGTVKTTLVVLSAFLAFLVFGDIAVDFADGFFPQLTGLSILEVFGDAVSDWPGPFQIFFGDWALIDV